MDESSRRQMRSLSHPKKQKSGVTTASASSRSHRLSPSASGRRSFTSRLEFDAGQDYDDAAFLDDAPRASPSVQRRDLSGSSGERLRLGEAAELPAKQSVATEASSLWVESSKLYSMAAQPTEGAHLNTQTSLHNLATGQSLGRNSILEEKDDIESEIIAMTAPTGREIELESNPADFSRQNQASSPENVAGDRRHGETDRMTSRYTRRWDTAPSPRRILDDSALEVDHPQQRSGKHRVEKDKRLRSSDVAKQQAKSPRHIDGAQTSGIESAIHQQARHSRAHEESGHNMAVGATAIQTAAKQTGFLQRHVSAKAERNTHSIKLNEDNLNSLQPRKEPRIDPRERILAWIEQGEACLKTTSTPRSSAQEFVVANYGVGQGSISQTTQPPKAGGRKPSKSAQRRKKKGGGLLACLGCWQ